MINYCFCKQYLSLHLTAMSSPNVFLMTSQVCILFAQHMVQVTFPFLHHLRQTYLVKVLLFIVSWTHLVLHQNLFWWTSVSSCCFDENFSGDTLVLNEDVSHWSWLNSYGKLTCSKSHFVIVKERKTANKYMNQYLLVFWKLFF